MLRNYIKIAWRNILRDKVFAAINIVGLASGMAVTIAIVQYAYFELTYENTHSKSDRVARVTMDYVSNGVTTFEDAGSYTPLGPRLKSEFPEVLEYGRLRPVYLNIIKTDEGLFRENRIYYSDRSLFNLFDFKLVAGDIENSFTNPQEVVITRSLAEMLFKDSAPIGKVINYFNNETENSLKVVAVIEDTPFNSHLNFDMLISISSDESRADNWNNNEDFTYILLDDAESIADMQRKMPAFNDQLWSENKVLNEEVVIQGINDIHLFSKKGYELKPPGDATAIYFLLAVAAFVILIAWVNYVNLATAKSLNRAKEVGIRKAVGSHINQLRAQFLIESAFSNLLAAFLSISFIQLMMPFLQKLLNVPSNEVFRFDLNFWLILTVLMLVGILLSGFYPAVVLSSFRPSEVLKGKFGTSSKGQRLRQSLVVLQFSLTIILLVGAISVNEQIIFMKSKDLGMNINNRMVIKAPSSPTEINQSEFFRNEILSKAGIDKISFSDAVPGMEQELSSTTDLELIGSGEGKYLNMYVNFVDHEFLSMYEISLLAGENFEPKMDNSKKIILNQEALRLLKVSDPKSIIGKKVNMWGQQRTIIGVTNNYHQLSVKSPHIPMILIHRASFNWGWSYASINLSANEINRLSPVLKKTYESTFPNSDFSYFFVDENYDVQYQSDDQFYLLFRSMTGMAIFIAGLGLFGLVAFTVSQKTKEIGIRKVLGATANQILFLLSGKFFKLIVFATILAAPLAYMIFDSWLDDYPYRINLSWWMMLIPITMIFIVAGISISLESFKAARQNPVKALRYE